jgi:lipopolysaccharide/colanic/teichoic acid biosynthesis glycosyltransferase
VASTGLREPRSAAGTAPAGPPRAEPAPVRLARRAIDLGVAAVALVVLSPLLIAIAIAIRLDSRGPALFRQVRVGRDRRPIVVNKFRTMRSGADPAPHREYIRELVTGEPARRSDGQRELFKLVVDDRVTRVGGFLRRTSLDELPQLWNVLRGEMSLVGPRPVVPYELDHYQAHYFRRFAVKPGLTGLWQVSGRNELSYTEMVELDLAYVERRTLRLDFEILMRTVAVVLARRGVA